ncbi:MAG: c-type cytochrome domain-containing protein, partial [Methylocella sp.]
MKCRFLFAIVWLATLAATQAAAAPAKVEFSRDVRPILSENCFACHGFDKAARKADLRLDTRDGATTARKGVTAVVPGKPKESELLARVMTADEDDVMPPKKSGKHLTPAQKETLRRWIEQGASYQTHWSFEPPKHRQPPKVVRASHPIDRFIQARLTAEKLNPSRLADLTTLI